METLVVVIVFAAIFGAVGAWIASVKHRADSEGCLLGCLLGPLGVIIEALLPTLTPAVPGAAAARGTAAAPAAPLELTRKCPDCAETIKAEAHVCRFCGARFSDEEVAAAVAGAAKAAEIPEVTEVASDDPSICRFCGRNSKRNWHSAHERICRDCNRRPEVQRYLDLFRG